MLFKLEKLKILTEKSYFLTSKLLIKLRLLDELLADKNSTFSVLY